MLTKRRMSVLALVLVAVMCLALVACQTTPGTTSTASSTGTTATTSSTAAALPAGYPAKPITCLYAFAAGGKDSAYMTKLFAKTEEQQGWKNNIVFSYKEGAGGKIGWTAIAQASPDGYTIGVLNSPMLGLAVAEAPQPFGVGKFVQIVGLMVDPGVVGVATNSQYKSLKDLVAAATAKPGQISVADTGLTTSESRAIHMFEMKAGNGCKFNIIPFDGGTDAIVAVRGNHADSFCLNVGDISNDIDAGNVVPLAVGTSERYAKLPNVPTYKEEGYDVWQYSERSLGGPIGFPTAIRDYLEKSFTQASTDPEVIKSGNDLGLPIKILPGAQVEKDWIEQDATLQALWKVSPWQ